MLSYLSSPTTNRKHINLSHLVHLNLMDCALTLSYMYVCDSQKKINQKQASAIDVVTKCFGAAPTASCEVTDPADLEVIFTFKTLLKAINELQGLIICYAFVRIL